MRDVILKAAKAVWLNHPAEDDCAFVILRWEGTEEELKTDYLPVGDSISIRTPSFNL